MKYCIDFYGEYDLPILNEVAEININISKLAHKEDLVEFCKIHNKQKINLCIEAYDENPDLIYFAFDFQKEHNEFNIGIRLPFYEERVYNDLKKLYPDMKIFFKSGVNDWEILHGFLQLGITDIYIIEKLGFEIEDVAKIVHQNGVKVRAFPNIAQGTWNTTPGILKFWIRPEDIDTYDNYIDICEFFYERYDQQITYYSIYNITGKWYGDLNEIIMGLDTSIDSRRLLPNFVTRRLNCGRKCLKGSGCNMCNILAELSKTLEEKALIFENTKEEEKKERTIANG